MNLWQRVQCLGSESLAKINEIYEAAGIPIDIRHHLASWIEVQLSELEPEEFLNGLQRQLDTLPFYVQTRLTPFRTSLQQIYAPNPQSLYNKIAECITEEHRLVLEDEKKINGMLRNDQSPGPCVNLGTEKQYFQPKNVPEVNTEKKLCHMLTIQSNQAGQMLNHLAYYQKEFAILLEEDQKLQGILRHHQAHLPGELFRDENFESKLIRQREESHAKIRAIAHSTKGLDTQLEAAFVQIINQSSHVLRNCLQTSIRKWKYEQRRSFVGFQVTLNISDIQSLAEDLAEVLWTTREQLKRIEEIKSSLPMFPQDNTHEVTRRMFEEINRILKELFQETFIIEHQTLPIIRTDTRFYLGLDKKPLTVGSLIAEKLNPRMTPPKVTIRIVDKDTAEKIVQRGSVGEEVLEVGKLGYNVSTMESIHPERPHFAAVFRHIRLKNLANSRRRGHPTTELVTDKKYWLLCTTRLSIADFDAEVWTMSVPLVVTTHVTQECRAWATLLWDYGLSSVDKPSFEVPDRANWTDIMEILNVFFSHAIGTRLTQDQCEYLTKKAERCSDGNLIETLDDLCKEQMEGRKFSYWEWFYGCLKLAKDHFKKEFHDGHVIGFIGKDEAEEKLQECQPWTFLMRFSDSICGAISIVCVMDRHDVCSLSPFDAQDLERRSLADKINDLVQLQYLYPHHSKSEVFGDQLNLTSKEGVDQKKQHYKSIQQITIISGLPWNHDISGNSTPKPENSSETMEIEGFIDNLLEQNMDNVPAFDEPEFYRLICTLDESANMSDAF